MSIVLEDVLFHLGTHIQELSLIKLYIGLYGGSSKGSRISIKRIIRFVKKGSENIKQECIIAEFR